MVTRNGAKSKMREKIKRFHDKPWKHALLGLICFVLAYLFASWAVDSGRLTAYFLTIVFFILAVRQVIRAIALGIGSRKK